jgi:uncharacterized protein with ParB-like and HNH nuclease domain
MKTHLILVHYHYHEILVVVVVYNYFHYHLFLIVDELQRISKDFLLMNDDDDLEDHKYWKFVLEKINIY